MQVISENKNERSISGRTSLIGIVLCTERIG